MSSQRGEGKTLWVATFVAILVVGLVVFAALQLHVPLQPPAPEGPGSDAPIVITRVDDTTANALQERTALFDSSPLFLPTRINTSELLLPRDLQREPSAAFGAVPPQLTFAEFEMQVVFPDPIAVPTAPVAVFDLGHTPNPFFTLGRVDYPYTPLPRRSAFIEVVDAKTGSIVFAGPLDVPPSSTLPSGLWQPLELVAAVDVIGLVGEPTVTSGSGSESVDVLLRQLIAKEFRLGERLRPGFYSLRVGP